MLQPACFDKCKFIYTCNFNVFSSCVILLHKSGKTFFFFNSTNLLLKSFIVKMYDNQMNHSCVKLKKNKIMGNSIFTFIDIYCLF